MTMTRIQFNASQFRAKMENLERLQPNGLKLTDVTVTVPIWALSLWVGGLEPR